MSKREIELLLLDMLDAAKKIQKYTVGLNYDSFVENDLVIDAVARNFEIIGEAVNRILKEDANFPIENANRIVGLRNQIIHGYDSISDENIWAILHNHLPKLSLEVNAMIDRFPTMT